MSKIKELLRVSEEEMRKVKKIYEKTDDDVENDVTILSNWLEKQPHLPKPHDKVRLERFLLRNKFRTEQTKTKLDYHYTFKVLNPNFFLDLDTGSLLMQEVKRSFIIVPMPLLLPNLDRLVYCQFTENEEDHFVYLHVIKYCIALWELGLRHDYCAAEVYVCDLRHFTFKHAIKFDINTLYKAVQLFRNAFSGRVSRLDFVNAPPTFDILLKMFQTVMDAKLFGKIRLHKDYDSLYKDVPKDYLPKEAGGYLESIDDISDEWNRELILQKEYISENVRRTSNEKLRIGKAIHNDLFGTDGTFKKINLD